MVFSILYCNGLVSNIYFLRLTMENITLEGLREGSLLLFDKPRFWSSFDLVRKSRNIMCRATGGKRIKVGHAGTLDPLATGLMIVCTGKLTKSIQNYIGLEKEYIAVIKLGATTPSFDLETSIDREFAVEHINEKLILKVLPSFIGEQPQVPPAFSAKYIDGVRAYELARSGEIVEPATAMITIFELELLDYDDRLKELEIRVVCSKGTYIRSLARDIGASIGSGGYLIALKRTRIGEFKLENACGLDVFEKYVGHLKQIDQDSV